MKIQIRESGNRGFTIPLPLSLLQSRFLYRFSEDWKEYADYVIPIVRGLKQFKKENGSFVLVEIYSSSGDIIKITV